MNPTPGGMPFGPDVAPPALPFQTRRGNIVGGMSGILEPPGERNRRPGPSGPAGPLLFAAVLCGMAWLSAPASALGARCPSADALPRVSLETMPGRVVYDSRHSRQDLRRFQGKRGAARQRGEWHPIGLTITELQFRTKISVQSLPAGDGRHCAALTAVEAQLGYDTITIYVDRRYRRGSCPYVNVLEHEHLHLGIFRDTLAVYAPKVERRLSQAARRLETVSARSPERGAEKLQKALQREMAPLFKEMNDRIDAANERLDTAANYTREKAKCSNW